MATYHQRRPEKAILDAAELLEVIDGQGSMTLAMSKGNVPYLVTVNYGYEPEKRCFYFHCSRLGKKYEYLRENPTVWGQVLEDNGYLDGACDHAFRTVQFLGRVTMLQTDEDKRHALDVMIDHLESDPAEVKKRLEKPDAMAKVVLMRVDVEEMTGKKNPVKKTP